MGSLIYEQAFNSSAGRRRRQRQEQAGGHLVDRFPRAMFMRLAKLQALIEAITGSGPFRAHPPADGDAQRQNLSNQAPQQEE